MERSWRPPSWAGGHHQRRPGRKKKSPLDGAFQTAKLPVLSLQRLLRIHHGQQFWVRQSAPACGRLSRATCHRRGIRDGRQHRPHLRHGNTHQSRPSQWSLVGQGRQGSLGSIPEPRRRNGFRGGERAAKGVPRWWAGWFVTRQAVCHSVIAVVVVRERVTKKKRTAYVKSVAAVIVARSPRVP